MTKKEIKPTSVAERKAPLTSSIGFPQSNAKWSSTDMTLEERYLKQKEDYKKLGYDEDSWQWKDDGKYGVYEILCAERILRNVFRDEESARDYVYDTYGRDCVIR